MSKILGMSIRHHTGFTYNGMAKSSYNEARMTPLMTQHQEVISSKISVSPTVPLSTHIDYFGTIVTAFDLQEAHPQLEVQAQSTVRSWPASISESIKWQDLGEEKIRDQFSEYLFTTRRTALPADVTELVDDLRKMPNLHEVVEGVSTLVASRVKYVPGATTVSATAQEAWAAGVGVCQDITHITIGLLRGLSIPARYVSGYLYPSREPTVGEMVEGQSHAWVEYFSGEWTGIDPTNAVRETERHIIVGHGRDYDDVAPLKGIYQGAESSSLGVVVEMTRTS